MSELFFRTDIRDKDWFGEVIDTEDPEKLGRVKVRVFGLFDELDEEVIPWAKPALCLTGGSSTGSGFHSVPKQGSYVDVKFDNGNKYAPEYVSQYRISDELKDELDGSYENAHSLIFDSEANPGPVKLFFTEDKGLMNEYNGSQINIRDDNSIFFKEDSTSMKLHITDNMISLGSEDESDEPAVLGDKNKDALDEIHDRIQDMLKIIISFASKQSGTASSVSPTAGLAPALTELNAKASKIMSQLPKLKSQTIPQTRSQKITLDGPPKTT